MTFCGKVDDAVNFILAHYPAHSLKVNNVGFDECVVRFILDVFQIGEVAGVGQFVEIDDVVVGVFVYKQPYYMAADKPCSAGDEYITLHFVSDF